jgi:hypothetical protein
MSQLRAAYAKVRELLVQGRVEDAHSMIKRFFEARRKFYNERHDRITRFISPLLKSFCLAWKESIERKPKAFDPQKANFINDFLNFCVEAQRYDELEILLQECRCPITQTRANSPSDIFYDFDYDETRVQGQVAHIFAPGDSLYWEDSRTYCRTWSAVTMKRVYPDPPMPGLPIAVTVHSDRIESPDTDGEQALRDSEFMIVLNRLREAKDWRIFSAWEWQDRMYQVITFVKFSTAHKIWIFPEDVVECKGANVDVSISIL